MSARLRVTVLGCGSSGGVPRIGGDWGACDPNEPRNKRSRGSILIEKRRESDAWTPETTTGILIDTSPDLRMQLLAANVERLDAVLYSHEHADQTHGIDDLRVLAMRMKQRVPVYMDAATAKVLTKRFNYCFEQRKGGIYPPILEARAELKPGEPVVIDGPGGRLELFPLAQEHGPIASLGFRVGDFAYSNDVNVLPPDTKAALTGLKIWIVDALRYTSHVSHANVATALGWISELAPQRAYLTNLHVDLDYANLDAETPEHVSPAHDGLRLEMALDE